MKPIKTNVNRPKLSSQEIDQLKDFDSIHDAHIKLNKPYYKSYWFIGACIIATIIGALFTIDNISAPYKTEVAKTKEFRKAENNGGDKMKLSPFKSPIEDIEIPFSQYKINAKEGGRFTHHTGSTITIPKNAFQTYDGKEVNGPVTINYREFHDPLDILLSGIPMNYDSSGIKNSFESAGMIELRVFKDGKALKFAPNKHADIEMVSNNSASKFNLYALNDKTSNWTYIGKDEIVTEEIWGRNIKAMDIDQIAQSIETQESNLKEHLTAKPSFPISRNKANYSFDLEVNQEDFPYLSQFENVEFEVLSGQGFSPEIYTQTWHNAQLSELVKGQVYIITLTGDAETKSYKVRPILSGKDLEKAMYHYDQNLKVWDEKKTIIETDLTNLKTNYENRIKTIKEEVQLKHEQQALEEKNQKSLNEISSEFLNSNTAAVKRKFKIRLVGICNIDYPIPLQVGVEDKDIKPKGERKAAYFMNRISRAILAPAVVYIIEKGKNLIYKFNRKELAEFSLNKSEENTIWFLTRDGNVAVCRAYESQHLEETEEAYHVVVEVSSTPFKSKESLEAFLLGNT